MLTFELQSVLRRLRAHPMLTAVNVVVLGIGLGAFLFLLSLVNGLILQPLPFPHADRLVGIGYEREGNVGIGIMNMADFTLLKRDLAELDLAADSEANVFIDQGSGAVRYSGAWLTANVLSALGEQPLMGRAFTLEDERPGAQQVVLLSETAWRGDFGADPAVVGKTVRVNAEPAIVVGVMKGGFAYPTDSRVWLPLRATQTDADLNVVGSLPASMKLDAGRQALAAAAASLGDQLEGQRAEQNLIVKPLKYRFVSEAVRKYVWLMFAASFLVLMLACANSINLQLGRVLNRRVELAIYSALGSGSRRLLREALFECLALTVLASLIGLGAVQLGTTWILSTFAASEGPPAYFGSGSIRA
jgi:ABC-type antimicrobial peptide transport system permease subunit